MKRKLKRRRSVFGRRGMPKGLKTALTLLVCAAVVAGGYWGAKLVSERKDASPDVQVSGDDAAPAPPASDDTVTPDGEPSRPDDSAASSTATRAFYLPHSALTAEDLSATLTAAADAGFNAAVFDLKDADGTLYYQFSTAQAKKVNAYAADALTADGLTALFAAMRQEGLRPIPRLYAFCDNAAAKVLTDARISHKDNHSWSWLDAAAANGGRRWLNPYSDAAYAYLSGLAEELKDLGAAAVMLDGVQFPHQLKDAYLGEEAATVSKGDALAAFVGRVRTLLGADCPLLLGCTAESALGSETQIYGGNPLTFGATAAAPLLSYSGDIRESVEKMILRTQVLTDKPTLTPMLETAGLSAAQVNDAIGGVIVGGTDSFILYAADGAYDFSAYNLP